MKIKFLKDYAINRGDCPLEIGGFAALETEIVKADTVVDLEKDNRDDAFSDELVRWLIDNGFAEEVKESSWWKPKYDEEYFYVGHDSYVHPCIWKNDPIDNGRLKLGLVFKTEEAGMRCRNYLEAVAIVRQDEGVLTPNELQEKKRDYKKVVFIGYDSMGRLATNPISLFSYDIVINAILFDNETNARASLDNHPSEWKIIANYDWSRE